MLSEDLIPIDIAWLKLRDCRVSAIVTTYSRPDAEASLGEIKTVSRRTTDTVVLDPAHE